MKIAIQGHPTRGKEVIQILESLGGNNLHIMEGSGSDCCYYIDSCFNINDNPTIFVEQVGYKIYTLEEFEKEFPFKIGDIVFTTITKNMKTTTFKGVVKNIHFDDSIYPYHCSFEDSETCSLGGMDVIVKCKTNELFKMQKERNITLTLEKAKEWYNKGGELKEIALQAFKEEELNSLPRSWEEFVESTKFTFNCSLEYINGIGHWSNSCLPNKAIGESSEIWDKYVALFQLEQLRNYWIQNRTYKWDDHSLKYQIKFMRNQYEILALKCVRNFLTFPTREVAEEFLECFRDLIEQAGDLI